MTEQVKCPICTREYAQGTEHAAMMKIYGECGFCCAAHQQQVDPIRVQAQILADKPAVATVVTQEHVFTVRVTTSKPIKELKSHIENRLWSLDKVTGVVAVEH